MKVSQASAYALHALMYMVRHITLLPVSNRIIAKSEKIPPEYLAKIFRKLVKNKIVISSKKGSGGYLFARPPEEISVLDVIQAIEGETIFDECFMQHGYCERTAETSSLLPVWQEAAAKLKGSLGKMSLIEATWSHPQHYFGNRD